MEPVASRGATLLAVGAVHFLIPFMMSAVGIALPSIGRELGASARGLGLVETAYVTSAAVFLLPMGRLGDIRGRRRVFQWGLGVFTLVGGLLSLSRSIEALILLRFLQGMGGAMVNATGLAMVVSVFPPEERGKALGLTVASVYLGISCGPFLGGALVAAAGWRSLFVLSCALGAAALLLVSRRLQGEWAQARGEPFDWLGSLVYGISILLLVGGASSLARWPWAWGVAAAGVAGLVFFAVLESRTAHPILDVRFLRGNRLFLFSSLGALLNYASTFGVTFFLSLYLQYVRGMSPWEAGTVLFLQPLVQALLSPACGRLADRYPPERVATAGMALCAVGVGAAATVTADTPLPTLLFLLAVLGTGFALFSSPNTSAIMGSVPSRFYGLASGVTATMRTLGMMVSMTIVTLAFSVFMGGSPVTPETREAFLASMRAALFTFSLLCVAGVAASALRLRGAARPGAGEADS
ncbi:MAG: MFS transporter [Deferrisomatales bacterium]|nr:MFS transporter [Deferrisomatales bacterium]